MGVNPAAQSAPDSPPSFGDAKGSDNDSSFQCSERVSSEFYLLDVVFIFSNCMCLVNAFFPDIGWLIIL